MSHQMRRVIALMGSARVQDAQPSPGSGQAPFSLCTAIVEVVRKLRRNAAVPPFRFIHFNEFGFVSDSGFRVSDFRHRPAASTPFRVSRSRFAFHASRFTFHDPLSRFTIPFRVSRITFHVSRSPFTFHDPVSRFTHHVPMRGGRLEKGVNGDTILP
jgi:hypothetical protein